jgi:Flp pilus assembly protein TadD
VRRAAEAEELFRRAIALRPDLPDAYFNLGTALAVQGRYAEAAAPMRTYMERVPQSAAGPERLGLVYLLEGRYETAAPLLREALLRRPDASDLRTYLARALEGQARTLQAEGRSAEAETLLVEARALTSSMPVRSPGSGPASRP